MKLIELNEHYYLLSNDEIKDGREYFWTYDHLNKKPLHISYIKYFGNENNGKGDVKNGRASFKTVDGTSSGTSHKEIIASTDNIDGLPKISILSLIELWKDNDVDVHKLSKEFADCKYSIGFPEYDGRQEGFFSGYNQSLEDNLDKKFTTEDIKKAYIQGGFDNNVMARRLHSDIKSYKSAEDYINFLSEKKLEWDIGIETEDCIGFQGGVSLSPKIKTIPKVVLGYINILKIK